MKFCLKCNGSGRILEQRLSDYTNSFDYYPVPCPECLQEETKKPKLTNNKFSRHNPSYL